MMSRRLPKRDPLGACQREAIAERRVGFDAQCACGESRPFALIANTEPRICAECECRNEGRTTKEKHHVAGKQNSPIRIMIPINDHRARLSEDQRDWPKDTLRNPDHSPLLTAAACIRGFIDTVIYLAEELLLWVAERLEAANEYLISRLGPRWWTNIEFLHNGASDAER